MLVGKILVVAYNYSKMVCHINPLMPGGKPGIKGLKACIFKRSFLKPIFLVHLKVFAMVSVRKICIVRNTLSDENFSPTKHGTVITLTLYGLFIDKIPIFYV